LYQSLANTSHESAQSFSPEAVLGTPVVSKSSSLKNLRDRRRNFRPSLWSLVSRLSRICAIGAEISVLVFYERLIGNDFVTVAAAEAVLVKFVFLLFPRIAIQEQLASCRNQRNTSPQIGLCGNQGRRAGSR